LESQARSKISGVANARSSSWNRAPIDRMANINLEGGNLTLEEMISKIEHGIIMFANRSWSIDDYRRKFQFGCEYARRIENGKLGQVYKNPNYRGVTVPFWNSLVGLTRPDTVETYGSPYCGKGEPSQIIRVGHSSPYAHFKNIEVFGG
jgi:predicted Zn-dependent protease